MQNHLFKDQSTYTEDEPQNIKKCKYCTYRVSKLKLLEKMKTKASSNSYVSSNNGSNHLKVDKGCQTSAFLFEKAEMTQKELRSLSMILRSHTAVSSKNDTFCKCVIQGRERDCKCGETDKCKY